MSQDKKILWEVTRSFIYDNKLIFVVNINLALDEAGCWKTLPTWLSWIDSQKSEVSAVNFFFIWLKKLIRILSTALIILDKF